MTYPIFRFPFTGEPILGKVVFSLTVNGISFGIIDQGDWRFYVGMW